MVRLQPSVELSLLPFRQLDRLRNRCNAVPQVLDELDALGHAQAQHLRGIDLAHVPSLPHAPGNRNLSRFLRTSKVSDGGLARRSLH